MFNSLIGRIRFWKGKYKPKHPLKPESRVINKMSERIDDMKSTLTNSSPRSFGLLFILSSVPTFYFVKKMLETEYDSEDFKKYASKTLNYYYFKNGLFLSVAAVLSAAKFINPASKYTVPPANPAKFLIPIIATLIGLSLPPNLTGKYMVAPTIVTDVATLSIQAAFANEGILPFWYFNHRYYLHLFDLVSFAVCYRALSKQQQYLKEQTVKQK